MCGIFAYHGPGRPDPWLLSAAAIQAARRGPHGHGWFTRDAHGNPIHHRQLGELNGDLAALAQTAHGPILGHARLATFGNWADPAHLQPVTADGHAVAHNGNIYNAADLAENAPTDTYALAAAYAALRAVGTSPERALAALLQKTKQETWAIVILDAEGSLIAHRHRHPLYARTAIDGVYVSSRPFDRACKPLPDSRLITLADGA